MRRSPRRVHRRDEGATKSCRRGYRKKRTAVKRSGPATGGNRLGKTIIHGKCTIERYMYAHDLSFHARLANARILQVMASSSVHNEAANSCRFKEAKLRPSSYGHRPPGPRPPCVSMRCINRDKSPCAEMRSVDGRGPVVGLAAVGALITTHPHVLYSLGELHSSAGLSCQNCGCTRQLTPAKVLLLGGRVGHWRRSPVRGAGSERSLGDHQTRGWRPLVSVGVRCRSRTSLQRDPAFDEVSLLRHA